MAVVLLLSGFIVHARVADDLRAATDRDLRADLEVASAQTRADPAAPVLTAPSGREAFAQVIDERATVLASVGASSARALVDPVAALTPVRPATRQDLPGIPEASRILVTAVATNAGPRTVVVGVSIDDQHIADHRLANELVLGLGAALLASTALGWVVAGRALRPVELLRRRAASITDVHTGERLPVPPSGDELARLGETLNRMLDRIDEGLRHEREFVAEASHELRTPLTNLRMELDLATRPGRTPAELRAALESASDETERLSRLAADLLFLASADEDRIATTREAVDLAGLAQVVATRFSARAASEHRTVTVNPREAVDVTGDRAALDHAVTNLIDNALRHGHGAVNVEIRRNGSTVELHVRDEGPGLPADFVPRAFDRFARANASRDASGSGLGLAIVRTIADAHGGEAHASNAAEGGADVWFSVARARP